MSTWQWGLTAVDFDDELAACGRACRQVLVVEGQQIGLGDPGDVVGFFHVASELVLEVAHLIPQSVCLSPQRLVLVHASRDQRSDVVLNR